jgi:hypothetical protein
MAWEVHKCIIKIYIYTRIKFNVGQILVMHISVTPHVSKPHDYVNHMFMRP